jgi:hypothetical protein
MSPYDKLDSAQELVDRLLAMAETLEYNADRLAIKGSAPWGVLRGRAEGYKQAAWLLDQIL